MCSRRKIICSSLAVDVFHWLTIHTIMTPLRSHPWVYMHEFACSPHEGLNYGCVGVLPRATNVQPSCNVLEHVGALVFDPQTHLQVKPTFL